MTTCKKSVPTNAGYRALTRVAIGLRWLSKRYWPVGAGFGTGLLATVVIESSLMPAVLATRALPVVLAPLQPPGLESVNPESENLETKTQKLANETDSSSQSVEYLPAPKTVLRSEDTIASSLPTHCLAPEPPTDWRKLARAQMAHARAQMTQWRSTLSARQNPASWPGLHEQARLANVPVMMYHDVLPEKEVFFDITIDELEEDFRQIEQHGLTPISLDRLVSHLRTGLPLPARPIVLTFDDGYVGHYDTVFELLKRFNYPAAFSVFTGKLDGDIVGRSTLTWEQLQEMADHRLVTVVSHSVTHPSDLTQLSDEDIRYELTASRRGLEERLGMPIRYFTYPEGNHDDRVVKATGEAGYRAAMIMDNVEGHFVGESEDLLRLERFGKSRFDEVIKTAWGGSPISETGQSTLDLTSDIMRSQIEVDEVPLTLILGGRLQTIHADTRYALADLVADTDAIAAVDGTFFSLESLDSNIMIGPVLSQNTGKFVPGSTGDIDKLNDRPLVLIGPQSIKFVPFNANRHNTLAGVQQEMSAVTDAFVGAAWLVHKQEPRLAHTFKNLFAYEESRFRAFWGINQYGQPVVGATQAQVDSVGLGKRLAQAGFQEAVMLDSGASTSLVYEGESQMIFEPRPVPHALTLVTDVCSNKSAGYQVSIP